MVLIIQPLGIDCTVVGGEDDGSELLSGGEVYSAYVLPYCAEKQGRRRMQFLLGLRVMLKSSAASDFLHI